MSPDEAMAVLKAYLRTVKMTESFQLDEGLWLDKNGECQFDSSKAADIARDWARELLTEAEANGCGGCRLCRS